MDKLFGESKDRLQLPASVSLLDFWACGWPGHTGTRAQPDPRAHGQRGTRAQPRSTGTRAHGHTDKGHQRTNLCILHVLLCFVFYVKCRFMLCFVCFVEFGKLFLVCHLRSASFRFPCGAVCFLVLLLRLFSLYTTILDFVSGSVCGCTVRGFPFVHVYCTYIYVCSTVSHAAGPSPIVWVCRPFTRYLRHFGAATSNLHAISEPHPPIYTLFAPLRSSNSCVLQTTYHKPTYTRTSFLLFTIYIIYNIQKIMYDI